MGRTLLNVAKDGRNAVTDYDESCSGSA